MTIEYAHSYVENIKNPPVPQRSLTWKDILADEPFEGQHWQGVFGLEPGSIRGLESYSSEDSSPNLSPLQAEGIFDEDSVSSLEMEQPAEADDQHVDSHPRAVEHRADPNWGSVYAHRRTVEELQLRQYWRPEWRTDASLTRPFDIGDASTLGPSLKVALGNDSSLRIDGPEDEVWDVSL
jgi:gamma-tubulin complex component 5